jgi:transcriptional regulator with XRE-family HTH domain
MAGPIEDLYSLLGRRLTEARIRSDLTQAELGRRLRPALSRASVANIEAGRQRVQLHTVFQLAEILGLQLGPLIEGLVPVFEAPTAIELELATKLSELGPERRRQLAAILEDKE